MEFWSDLPNEGWGEVCMHLCVWIKGGLEFFSLLVAHVTCW
jgi:hypothetical protein